MSHFYLTLPSNASMDCYPDNTVAKYTTKLTNTIALDGNWEVGLVEIACPGSLVNIHKNDCTFTVVDANLDVVKRYSLKPGYYRNVKEIVDGLNKVISETTDLMEIWRQEESEPVANFAYNEAVRRVIVNVKRPYRLRFNMLSRRIGISQSNGIYLGGRLMGRQLPRDKPHIRSLYVYCDLLQAVPVGDTKAPLLRVVSAPQKGEKVNMHKTMTRMMYLPVQKKTFRHVEIQILDDTGGVIPFQDGKSIVVLEFRRSVHPYFLGTE